MRFLLLAALALGVSSVLGGVLLERGPAPPDPRPACPVLASRLATADRIELNHAGNLLWLERRGATWGLARQGGYPVQPGRAEALIAALLTLELLKPAPGTLSVANQAGPDGGTLVRVLGLSGAILCAVVAGPPGSGLARRQGDPEGWIANGPVPASAELDAWSQHTLPPLDPASAAQDAANSGNAAAVIAGIAFTDVRPRPQIHPATLRTIPLALAGGTAVLTVGAEAGTNWLLVDGTAPWARHLAPYAFAQPADNPPAAP